LQGYLFYALVVVYQENRIPMLCYRVSIDGAFYGGFRKLRKGEGIGKILGPYRSLYTPYRGCAYLSNDLRACLQTSAMSALSALFPIPSLSRVNPLKRNRLVSLSVPFHYTS
jgi:hypothetical protein